MFIVPARQYVKNTQTDQVSETSVAYHTTKVIVPARQYVRNRQTDQLSDDLSCMSYNNDNVYTTNKQNAIRM